MGREGSEAGVEPGQVDEQEEEYEEEENEDQEGKMEDGGRGRETKEKGEEDI